MAPPAYIFVVRHGNRLDVADKHWHLSSPTPYDPPLTYSGWTQSRQVGTQISSILRDRAAQDDASQPDNTTRRRKRYRVVIHSSPFLRCIQTSIAISAGLLGRPSLLAEAKRNLSPSQVSQLASARPVTQSNGPTTRVIKQRRTSVVGTKTVLRIDAFLGEWLSPTYFELITPPPGSVMMLASAKASLLKAENYKDYPHLQSRSHSNSSASAQPPTNHLWGSSPKSSPLSGPPVSATEGTSPPSTLETLSGLQNSLPKPAPTSSSPTEIGAYEPPVPAFSIHKNATIPAGYVNHAKDACVVVDYQWDSMRAPYDWGDGGELPEDWPDMHKRFKKGLQSLVDWYTKADDPASAVTTEFVKLDGVSPEDEEDENVETVVVLVSHGAGCNAMIGAITHKPALMDIPISSLTMAALKKTDRPNGVGPGPEARTNGSVALHQTYNLILNASTDHLRSAATPNPGGASRSPSMASVFGGVGPGVVRGRSSNSFSSPSGSSSPQTHAEGLNRSSSISGSLASIRRGLRDQASARGGLGISGGSTPSGLSVGLWSPTPKEVAFELAMADEEALVIEGQSPPPKTRPKKDQEHDNESDERHDQLAQLPSRKSPAGRKEGVGVGLWISNDDGVLRDQSSSKRRWTVTERP